MSNMIYGGFGAMVESNAAPSSDILDRTRLVVAFLHAIPDRMRAFRGDIREEKDKAEAIQDSIDRQELSFLQIVSNDKASYPNEQSRKSAVAMMMDGSSEILDMKNLQKELNNSIRKNEYEVERLERQFRAYLAEKDLLYIEALMISKSGAIEVEKEESEE